MHADHDVVLARLLLAGLIAVGAATAIAGVSPQAVRSIPCPFHLATGVCCPGCGMTRSCLSLVRGEWAAAFGFHPLSFALLPLACLFAVCPRQTRRSWRRLPLLLRRCLAWTALAILLVFWIGRLLWPGLVPSP